MRTLLSKSWAIRLAVVFLLVAGSVYLVSADGPEFTTDQKAFYADADLVAFVRPGLGLKIVSAQVAVDGTISVRFTVSDPKGLPLDREGIYTPGAVSTSFVAAYIPKGKTQYVSYTTRTQVSPITNVSAVQAGSDSGGTYVKNADGDYTYTFKTKAPSGYDRTATHTIGLYGRRDLTEFDLGIKGLDTTFDFVPDGSPVVETRDVIRTVTCNKCHQDLSAHGTGGRKSMPVCILCHTPQTIDPDTGHTMDMAVLIHKIHNGADLPSVVAGTPYVIIGNSQSRHDYSKAVFPADTRRCTFCHEQNTGAAQATAYLNPNRDACGSCHDNVNFATGENHVDLPQISDNQCAWCHTPEGELEFDASISGAHTIPTFSRELPGTVFELGQVTNAAAGQKPTVTFTIKDDSGTPILPAQMTRLSLLISGPNTDYPSVVREDARTAVAGTNGVNTYTFTAALPADAKGSFTVGIEGYRNITLLPGTVKQQTARNAGVNKVLAFSVDGSQVKPRRTVVATANCNKCHAFLAFHGGNRNQIEQCVLCHNPNATAPSPTGSTLPPQAIDLRTMVHKIHTGEELAADYSIGNNSFNGVVYPGDRRRCNACHVNNSQQLPLDEGLLPVVDPRGYLNPNLPEAAACTSCHGTLYAASHALANTTRLGESCATCHRPNAEFSVDKVHAQ